MSKLRWLVMGFGLGALAAYVLDPENGSKRRQMIRRNSTRLSNQVNDIATKSIDTLNTGVESISSLIGEAPDAKTSGDSHSVH
jgi:hypothetical protein